MNKSSNFSTFQKGGAKSTFDKSTAKNG